MFLSSSNVGKKEIILFEDSEGFENNIQFIFLFHKNKFYKKTKYLVYANFLTVGRQKIIK